MTIGVRIRKDIMPSADGIGKKGRHGGQPHIMELRGRINVYNNYVGSLCNQLLRRRLRRRRTNSRPATYSPIPHFSTTHPNMKNAKRSLCIHSDPYSQIAANIVK